MASGSKLVLYAALAGNLAIAVTKFAAAAIAGSSAMLTEGIHSLVDTCNQGLLLYGRNRSEMPPDEKHPLGHGRELYFWAFVVALLIFTTGAGASVYEGIVHIQSPEQIEKPWINFVVLGLAFVFEGSSLYIAVREFRQTKDPAVGYWRALRDSKDPAIFVVLMEDSAALAGLVVAAVFIGLAVWTGNPVWDGIGSIVIGILLIGVAIMLASESKKLLIGERARPEVQRYLAEVAKGTMGVCLVNEVITVHMSPEDVIATISLDFQDDLPLSEVEKAADSIEAKVKARYPEVRRLFIRPQSRVAAVEERAALQFPAATADF
ncbi:cation transporter [Tsuneonella deserti]|uniref:Cation transporter n=1 Tax=Tsuneonella deserti TaxID=2035528 RepID=A0ABQ1S8U1_9SPHN|nr:cation diffusion facilitator family transporter [Tsuneonella deserti]GGD93970.1 cation transporter [Tsuneonella deserti]